ncbi:hypothetical protein [Pseudonocardia broussonetiae]|uniref:Uncharacterized protein n=1 Tax=Pseudonocardia broussonetiae TaxID=2736640 RepID=A0A6M6JHW4_9PSEU|nr:hypothetical protein [Pseudonocardia broussonetiae]QJY46640.1 hypothetical protein HOP40_13120 [Pseudonocardia broussonetiae]
MPDPEPLIYRQLSDEHHVDVPAVPPGQDPATTMLPAYQVRYGPAVDWAWPPGDDDDRADGWCEDRSPELGEITRNDGED